MLVEMTIIIAKAKPELSITNFAKIKFIKNDVTKNAMVKIIFNINFIKSFNRNLR
jgi:hypothetical protein